MKDSNQISVASGGQNTVMYSNTAAGNYPVTPAIDQTAPTGGFGNCYYWFNPFQLQPQTYFYPITIYPAQLSDNDINRIAEAVAQKLKEHP